MTYRTFRRTVEAMLDDIPSAFLVDLQGVHALEAEKREEGFDDVWRMGEYLDPGPEDFLGGGEGLGRHVALYWGSFARLAEDDPSFDWDEEIWETLVHELQHHVESLAGDGRLIEQDLADARAFFGAYDDEEDDMEAEAASADRHDEPSAGVHQGVPGAIGSLWRRLRGRTDRDEPS